MAVGHGVWRSTSNLGRPGAIIPQKQKKLRSINTMLKRAPTGTYIKPYTSKSGTSADSARVASDSHTVARFLPPLMRWDVYTLTTVLGFFVALWLVITNWLELLSES